jgi:hypothetical protein
MMNDGDSFQASWAIQVAAQNVCAEQCRPCVLWRPRLYPDGNMWCALYGDDLQSGVAGFGETAEAAMRDFDSNWLNRKLP